LRLFTSSASAHFRVNPSVRTGSTSDPPRFWFVATLERLGLLPPRQRLAALMVLVLNPMRASWRSNYANKTSLLLAWAEPAI
jgi:hypothetical protein